MSWLTLLLLIAIWWTVCLLCHRQSLLISKFEDDLEFTGLRSRRNFTDDASLLSKMPCRLAVLLFEAGQSADVGAVAALTSGRAYRLSPQRVAQVFSVLDRAEAEHCAREAKRQLGSAFAVAWAFSEPDTAQTEPHNRRSAQRMLRLAETNLRIARRTGEVYPRLQPPNDPPAMLVEVSPAPVEWERVQQIVIGDPVAV